jgi:iron complex outermembrane receptor protein
MVVACGNRKTVYKLCLITTILAGIFGGGQSLAAGNVNNFELSPEQLLNATVMSVSKKSEKLMDAPAAIYVITNEDIKRSGATSIPEALRMAPGVNVARVNNAGWAISIRGFNGTLANKLLVLIDGREVYDPLYSGVYWDVQDTPLEDIERIEVIRGPGATLWGSNAVNGVINIITKNAFDTAGNLVSVTGGNKEAAITARHGGKLGDDSYYRMYEKSFNRASQQGTKGNYANDEWQEHRTGFRSDWKNDNKQSAFTLQGDAYGSEDGNKRIVSRLSSPFSRTIDEDIMARGANILGRWNKTTDNNANITVASYLDYTSRNQAYLKDERFTYDLDAQYEFADWNINKIIVGGKYRTSNDQLRQTENPMISFASSASNTQTLSGFIQDKITLQPEKWFLTLGSKFEDNDYTGIEIEPNARLQWHPDEKDMIWTSVSRAVRTPSRLEEDLRAVQAAASLGGGNILTIDTLPNHNLESEELIAYELGYRRQLTQSATLDISSFYNDYSNLITYTSSGLISAPSVLTLGLTPYNNGKAHSYGGEALIDWRISKTVKLSTSYSLLQMNVEGPSVSGSRTTERQSPKNQFNIHAFWDVTDKLSFDTSVYYVSSLPAYQVSEYTRLDMHIGYRIADGVELNLVGQNLLDNAHREFLSPTANNDGFPVEINRSIYGNITWRF